MKRQYLKDRDRVYTTGAWLMWDAKKECFMFDGIEDDTFFDGENVNFDENEKPYICESRFGRNL